MKVAQANVDKDPFSEKWKEESCSLVQEYHEAVRDEENFLLQKVKIEWLKEGDRNTSFFSQNNQRKATQEQNYGSLWREWN